MIYRSYLSFNVTVLLLRLGPEPPEQKDERESVSDKKSSELYMGSKEWLKVAVLWYFLLYIIDLNSVFFSQ